MAIKVQWNSDHHNTILVTYEAGWTWDDYSHAKVEIDNLLNSVDYTVHIISDSRGAGMLPRGNALTYFARAFQTAPGNIGLVVVVGGNIIFRSLLQLLQTVSLNRAANNICFAYTIDEARELLKERRGVEG
ncbi:MAG: hypothetical protein R3E39_08305 [Anaerolineae bacterium]